LLYDNRRGSVNRSGESRAIGRAWLHIAGDPSCVVTMLRFAEGSLSEKEFDDWIRANT